MSIEGSGVREGDQEAAPSMSRLAVCPVKLQHSRSLGKVVNRTYMSVCSSVDPIILSSKGDPKRTWDDRFGPKLEHTRLDLIFVAMPVLSSSSSEDVSRIPSSSSTHLLLFRWQTLE